MGSKNNLQHMFYPRIITNYSSLTSLLYTGCMEIWCFFSCRFNLILLIFLDIGPVSKNLLKRNVTSLKGRQRMPLQDLCLECHSQNAQVHTSPSKNVGPFTDEPQCVKTYLIRSNYGTVHLGLSKTLGKLVVKYPPNKGTH